MFLQTNQNIGIRNARFRFKEIRGIMKRLIMLKTYSWDAMTLDNFDMNTYCFVFEDGTYQPVYSRLLHCPFNKKVIAMNGCPIPSNLKNDAIELVLNRKISYDTSSSPGIESNV